MQRINLKIFELFIEENTLNISMRVRGKYNPKVRKPHVTAIFNDGKENRYLPLLVKTYYPNESMTEYDFFASYKYGLNNLFFYTDEPQHIILRFEISYGENTYNDIELLTSQDLIITNSDTYEVSISSDKKFIEIFNISPSNEKKFINKGLSFIQSIFRYLWQIVLFLISIALLPIFCLEALLSILGCVKMAPKNKKTGFMKFLFHVRWRVNFILRRYLGFSDIKIKLANFSFWIFKHFKPKSNRVTFISNRRDDISGNYEYIHKELVKNKNLDIRYVLDVKEGYFSCLKYGFYLATSKVILLDDYVKTVYRIKRREDNYLIQVWHACGAFKTFGFSRLGKQGGPKQSSRDHRNYDYCTVSSSEICKYYAEGFGLSLEKIVATGVPRTDIFFNEEYKLKAREKFYEKYPHLKNKKIILFAPTFRGNGKKSGFYPHERFDFIRLYEHFKGEYAIIIKHHPFVSNKVEIKEEYAYNIIDMSDNFELNDLLFITDILITDYSSVVFEASLLNISMLFYAFDLQNYIATRGFYYEYDDFVPGKIVSNMNKLIQAIKDNDFESQKIDAFKHRFFDELDGKAGYRVAMLIEDLIKGRKK